MIFREMPPIWDAAFRPQFYARWGRESAVISASSRRAVYADFRQLLSIKCCFGGEEDYFVDGRRISVDDDSYLVLNEGRVYGSRIESHRPVRSFSIFFERGLIDRVWQSMRGSGASLLEEGIVIAQSPVEFEETLHPHDSLVTPVLKHIQAAVDAGLEDPVWIDEQLVFLLGRLLKLHHNRLRVEDAIPSGRPATRRELMRRVGLAANFIHSNYRRPIELQDMAEAAHLSRFHFLRSFRAVHGLTPSEFLNGKRTQAAVRLLRGSDWTMSAIAEYVGFGSRTTLFRHLRHLSGMRPQELRRREA